jgi:hypothetical protein
VYLFALTWLREKNLAKLLSTKVWFGLGIVLNVLFFLWYNNTYYLSIGNQGYSEQLFSSWLSPFPQVF